MACSLTTSMIDRTYLSLGCYCNNGFCVSSGACKCFLGTELLQNTCIDCVDSMPSPYCEDNKERCENDTIIQHNCHMTCMVGSCSIPGGSDNKGDAYNCYFGGVYNRTTRVCSCNDPEYKCSADSYCSKCIPSKF